MEELGKRQKEKKLQMTASFLDFGGLILDGAEDTDFLGAGVAGDSGSALGPFVRGKDEAPK